MGFSDVLFDSVNGGCNSVTNLVSNLGYFSMFSWLGCFNMDLYVNLSLWSNSLFTDNLWFLKGDLLVDLDLWSNSLFTDNLWFLKSDLLVDLKLWSNSLFTNNLWFVNLKLQTNL